MTTKPLTLTETADALHYSDGLGMELTIHKRADALHVEHVVPSGQAAQTWQELKDHLSDRVQV